MQQKSGEDILASEVWFLQQVKRAKDPAQCKFDHGWDIYNNNNNNHYFICTKHRFLQGRSSGVAWKDGPQIVTILGRHHFMMWNYNSTNL